MERADRNNRKADPERKWIRLQEIGLCQLLAIPLMIMSVVVISGGWTLTGPRAAYIVNVITMVSLLLVSSGGACFKIGYDKRVELRDKEDNQEDRIARKD